MTHPPPPAAIAISAFLLTGCTPSMETEDGDPALVRLAPAAQRTVDEAMARVACTCGRGSLAACRAADHRCPRSARAYAQAVELARVGADAESIRQALVAAPSRATAPIPAAASRRQEAGHAHLDRVEVPPPTAAPGNNLPPAQVRRAFELPAHPEQADSFEGASPSEQSN